MKKKSVRVGNGGLLLVVAAALAAGVPQLANADRGRERGESLIAPPNSHAYGKTLAEWLGIYWRWNYSGAEPAQSTVGNVQLVPLPSSELISGSYTPADPALLRGRLELTVPPGTPFVLPEFAWILERYNNGLPDDQAIADNVVLAGTHPRLTIDGQTVLSDRNKAAYYIPPTAFDPIVIYPQPSSYGSVAALAFQGVGVVGHPLSEGVHVIHLYEPITISAGAYAGLPDGLGMIYDNTWVITVARPARVISPGQPYRGASYGEWAVRYWQWVMGIPAAQNPLLDTTGEFAGVGQGGPVWFLGGTMGDSAERTLSVPAGKAIFMPVHQWIFGAAVNDCEPTVPGVACDVPTLRAAAATAALGATVLEVFIDGRLVPDITDYRTLSPGGFNIALPADNVLGLAGGTYGPHVADGYWLMLAPMTPGNHLISVHVVNPGPGIQNTVIYHLTVASRERD